MLDYIAVSIKHNLAAFSNCILLLYMIYQGIKITDCFSPCFFTHYSAFQAVLKPSPRKVSKSSLVNCKSKKSFRSFYAEFMPITIEQCPESSPNAQCML